MKFGTVDQVRDCTSRNNFGRDSATWVVWAHLRLVGVSSLFFCVFNEGNLHSVNTRSTQQNSPTKLH